jgi:hypothetical protein
MLLDGLVRVTSIYLTILHHISEDTAVHTRKELKGHMCLYCHVFRGVTVDGVWTGEWIY